MSKKVKAGKNEGVFHPGKTGYYEAVFFKEKQ